MREAALVQLLMPLCGILACDTSPAHDSGALLGRGVGGHVPFGAVATASCASYTTSFLWGLGFL